MVFPSGYPVSQVITVGEKEGLRAKETFQRKLTPGATFLPTYLLHNRLLESPYLISILLNKIKL